MVFDRVWEFIVNDVVVILLVLFIGLSSAKVVGRLSKVFLTEAELHRFLMKAGYEDFLSKVFEVGVYFLTAVFILGWIGILKYVLVVLAVFAVLLVVFNGFFSLVYAVPNVLAGFGLRLGPYLKLNGSAARVVDRSLIEVRVKTKSGDSFLVPNVFVRRMQKKVLNR